MAVVTIANDSDFQKQLKSIKSLVVVDFNATWCGPCRTIGPVFEQFAAAYRAAAFFKVDVDDCQETALSEGVSSVPCFIFYKDGVRIDSVTGANREALEEKVKKHCGSPDGSAKDHVDLAPYIEVGAAASKDLSATGSQIVFSRAVEIHSIALDAPECKEPKNIKLYAKPSADIQATDYSAAPSQAISFAPSNLASGSPIPLQPAIRNVRSLRVLVEGEKDGILHVSSLRLFGSPVDSPDPTEKPSEH